MEKEVYIYILKKNIVSSISIILIVLGNWVKYILSECFFIVFTRVCKRNIKHLF